MGKTKISPFLILLNRVLLSGPPSFSSHQSAHKAALRHLRHTIPVHSEHPDAQIQASCTRPPRSPFTISKTAKTYLVQIDDGLPELILRLVEIPHPDFAEVPGVVFVEIGAVMMLSTGHTAATGVLSMFADTAVAGGDVAATVEKERMH